MLFKEPDFDHIRQDVVVGGAALAALRWGVEAVQTALAYYRYPNDQIAAVPAEASKLTFNMSLFSLLSVGMGSGMPGSSNGFMTAYKDARKTEKRKFEMMDELFGEQRHYVYANARPVSSVGRQGVTWLEDSCLFTGADLKAIRQRALAMFDSPAGSVDVSFEQNAQLYLKDGYIRLDISNCGDTHCHYDVYEIRARHNMVPNMTANSSSFRPSELIHTGFIATHGNSDTQFEFRVGMTPFDSPPFTSNWNVKKKTSYCLAPGDLHHHISHWAPNQLFEPNEGLGPESTDDPQFDYFEHLSHGILIVQCGPPLIEVAGDESATYGASKLAVCITKKYLWKTMGPVGVPTYTFDGAFAEEDYVDTEKANPETATIGPQQFAGAAPP